MQDESKRLSVAITFGERGTVYGCGHALDTMLYAYGLTTEDSLWEWSADAEHEAMSYALNEYDWEEYTRDRFNNMNPSDAAKWVLHNFDAMGIVGSVGTKIVQSEYLPGDWLRIDFPRAFAIMVNADRRQITDIANETMGDWNNPKIPADLQKDLARAYDATQSEVTHQWLHGDRSNDGVLRQLAQAIFGRYTDAEVEWETKTDTVTIETTEEEWREWLGYDLDERDQLPSSEEIGERMKAYTLRKAQAVKEVRDARSKARQEDYKRRETIEQERLEKEKEEARQRKAKKNQA